MYMYYIIAGHVVARVRLDHLTAEAYDYCFKSVFQTVKKTCPQFAVGKHYLGRFLTGLTSR